LSYAFSRSKSARLFVAALGAALLSPVLVAAPASAAPAPVRTASLSAMSYQPAAVKAHPSSASSFAAAARARVVSIAYGKVGARYRAGRSGPSAFDCSGFSRYVWQRAAGKNLPHYSRAQFASLPKVSRSNLRAGDLVFFFKRGAHHVAVYVGNGKIVHAANPRKGVIVSNLSEKWYAQRYSGAARVV